MFDRFRTADTLLQDVRYGLRSLRKSPGFTTVVILTLALAIGANTAIFSLIDGLLLRPLPVHDPQELVLLRWSAHHLPDSYDPGSSGDCRDNLGVDSNGEPQDYSINPTGCSFSRSFFNQFRARSIDFSSIAAFDAGMRADLSGNGVAEVVRIQAVSGNYFETLGVRPALGRVLQDADDTPDATPVVVLSYAYWQTAFGHSAEVIGKQIELNGVPVVIVGVAESAFTSLTPGHINEVWGPLSLTHRVRSWLKGADSPKDPRLMIVGRLQPGSTAAHAAQAANLFFRNEMLHGTPPIFKESDNPSATVEPLQTGIVGTRAKYSTPLGILMLAVGIVLLIACANVAGLLISRSAGRRKEVALRLAVGASRWRIVRQLLTERVLLALLGGVLGAVLAFWGAHVLVAWVASGSARPTGLSAAIDMRVLVFTVSVSLLSGLVFGLAPVANSLDFDLTPTLKDGGSTASGQRRLRRIFSARDFLVVTQVALTLVVLAGAGLLVRTLQNLRSMDPGFETSHILNLRISELYGGYKKQSNTIYLRLQSRLGQIPGVDSVSYSAFNLLSGGLMGFSFQVPGAPGRPVADCDFLPVSPNFFATMRIPLKTGRLLSSSDIARSGFDLTSANASGESMHSKVARLQQPVLINETFVRQFFANQNPLGQHLEFTGDEQDKQDKYEPQQLPVMVVVGVVGDTKYSNLKREIKPTIYAAASGDPMFELRTRGNPLAIVSAVREAVHDVDSNLPIFSIQTQSAAIDQLLFQERLIAQLSSFFGLLALALACIGLYGLLAYEVARRTREIGIRMALGAGSQRVLANVVGKGLALSGIGVVIGLGVAVGVTRYLKSELYDVKPTDPITMISVTAILLLVALLACYIPARRATQVDPMVALRNE